MGYSDVTTVLQSGNVIVSTESDRPDEVAGAIRRLLSDEFDVNVPASSARRAAKSCDQAGADSPRAAGGVLTARVRRNPARPVPVWSLVFGVTMMSP